MSVNSEAYKTYTLGLPDIPPDWCDMNISYNILNGAFGTFHGSIKSTSRTIIMFIHQLRKQILLSN